MAPGLKTQTSSGACVVGLVQEGGDVFFLARIERARLATAAGGFDFGFQRGELVRGAPAGEDRVAFGGEALAMAEPMKSPAPMTAAVALRACMQGLLLAQTPADRVKPQHDSEHDGGERNRQPRAEPSAPR